MPTPALCVVGAKYAWRASATSPLSEFPARASFLLRDPEGLALGNLSRQFIRGHVGFVPAGNRYHSAIGVRRAVDNGHHRCEMRFHLIRLSIISLPRVERRDYAGHVAARTARL